MTYISFNDSLDTRLATNEAHTPYMHHDHDPLATSTRDESLAIPKLLSATMMNSTADGGGDEFGDNPFRSSSAAATNDGFFDASPHQQQQQQPPPLHSSNVMQGMPAMNNNTINNGMSFPPPSGPMDNMNGGGGGGGGMPPMQSSPATYSGGGGGTAGLMAPQTTLQQMPQQQQQQQQQLPGQLPQQPTSWYGNCMICINLDSYKQYFNIDADDIVTRIRGVLLHFYKPEHFRNNVLGTASMSDLKGPDLYGPFWITMTLIFLIGVTANMHHYLNSTLGEVQEFDYDINLLLHAASICVGYAFVLPLLLWTTTYCCMSITSLQLVEWVCLYGYSLVPYLPAVVLSIIPFGLVSWILLAVATGVSVLLVVRNVAHPMLSSDVGQAKAPPILLVILGSGVIFLLFLKFTFYHYTPSS